MEISKADRIHDIGVQLAYLELIRIMMGEMLYTKDPDEFRRRVQRVEEAAVNGVLGRNTVEGCDEASAQAAKETAAMWISQIMASIRLPN